jgi:maleylacetoacetate isomerase
MKLYGYWRSAAAFRVRIALNLKGIEAELVTVDVVGGEQRSEAYDKLNPMRIVPTLVDGDLTLIESLAIIEYLDERHPEPPLLPGDAVQRAQIRAVALALAADTHPLHTPRVFGRLMEEFGANEESNKAWLQHWVGITFDALEKMLPATAGKFCFGDAPTLADCCLVPQVIVGQRFGFDMAPYPLLSGIAERCLDISAFERALPTNQADAP